MTEFVPQAKDFLGRTINIGDYVVVSGPKARTCKLGKVVRILDGWVVYNFYDDWHQPYGWKDGSMPGELVVRVENDAFVTKHLLSIG